MSPFTEKEIEYLRGQRLGRLATVGSDGAPHVVPVGFRVGPGDDAIEVGGHGFKGSKKWRDLGAHPRVAFVVDDLERVDPWTHAGSRSAASPSCTRRAASASAKGGTRRGYGSCRGGSSAGGSRVARSRLPGGVTLARWMAADQPSRGHALKEHR